MQWAITGKHDGDVETRFGEKEEERDPDADLVSYARTAAKTLGEKLGGDPFVTIIGHESKGRGFQPGHVSITVSKVDPKA